MTTIREAILAENNLLRVTSGDTWLVGEDDGKSFTVYTQPAHKRRVVRVITTADEHEAVAALLGNEDEDDG